MKSIFTDRNHEPAIPDLKRGLGETFPVWNEIREFTMANYPTGIPAWKFSGEKFGWSYRISDHKRVILYLLPRDGVFKVAFVFGQKGTDKILESNISQQIKTELLKAKAYAEGRGIRIEVRDGSIIEDIKKLIEIKLG